MMSPNHLITLLFCAAHLLGGCDDGTLQTATGLASYGRTMDSYEQKDTTVTGVTNTHHADGRDSALMSAFFGLDNGLPTYITNRLACEGAGGADGMPIVFSHQVDHESLEPGDLKVTRSSGEVGTVTCLTLAPADDPGELRTALLAGEFGSAEDQPVIVEIIGNVLSLDGSINFKGARIAVTPLEAGPSLVWAEIVPQSQWDLGRTETALPWGGGSRCPLQTKQVVRVTWNGGITKPGGDPVGEKERQLYEVTVISDDQKPALITPFALADLNDGDNNHLLCLDTMSHASMVFFPAGNVSDPRDDLNVATTITVETRNGAAGAFR